MCQCHNALNRSANCTWVCQTHPFVWKNLASAGRCGATPPVGVLELLPSAVGGSGPTGWCGGSGPTHWWSCCLETHLPHLSSAANVSESVLLSGGGGGATDFVGFVAAADFFAFFTGLVQDGWGADFTGTFTPTGDPDGDFPD